MLDLSQSEISVVGDYIASESITFHKSFGKCIIDFEKLNIENDPDELEALSQILNIDSQLIKKPVEITNEGYAINKDFNQLAIKVEGTGPGNHHLAFFSGQHIQFIQSNLKDEHKLYSTDMAFLLVYSDKRLECIAAPIEV